MHLLFVCSHGRHRSVTAARLFASQGHLTRSAGCHPAAVRPVTLDDLNWADRIYVFERNHRNRIRSQWPLIYETKSIQCFYIADEWEAHDPALLQLLTVRMNEMTDSDTIMVPNPTPTPVPPTAFELSIAPVPLSDDQIYALRFHLLDLLPGTIPNLAIDLVNQLVRHQQALRHVITQQTHPVPTPTRPTP
ncbi:MAG: hypothetical protein ABL983_02575 [Nitrospira sp.]|jgi:predicted protein tyrosine phosphatase